MPDPEAALATQLANIEKTYGHPLPYWYDAIANSQLTKHSDVVAMLERDHGLPHSAAHRLSIVYRAQQRPQASGDPIDDLYVGRPASVRAIHDAVMAHILGLSDDIEVAPKKGYLSLRRRKQFAMVKPAAGHVDIGLILKETAPHGRLEDAATFNRLFTHRVRVMKPVVDQDLARWLQSAHAAAE
jgi:predicted transport protein